MKLLFVADPLSTFQIQKDSTFTMMREEMASGARSAPSEMILSMVVSPGSGANAIRGFGISISPEASFLKSNTLSKDVPVELR